MIQEKLNNLVDFHDDFELDPEPHFFDALCSPIVQVPPKVKGSISALFPLHYAKKAWSNKR